MRSLQISDTERLNQEFIDIRHGTTQSGVYRYQTGRDSIRSLYTSDSE